MLSSMLSFTILPVLPMSSATVGFRACPRRLPTPRRAPSAPSRGAHWKPHHTTSPPRCRATDTTPEEQTLLTAIDAYRLESTSAALHVLPKSAASHAGLRGSVGELERTAGFGASRETQKLLPGVWRLMVTDADAVARNAGSITGLSKLPGTKCVTVDVMLDANGNARTVESVRVLGLTTAENTLVGKWRVVGPGGDLLEVTYAEVRLYGKMALRADSKAVIKTTYCSHAVRIGRSRSGDFYVFVRQ